MNFFYKYINKATKLVTGKLNSIAQPLKLVVFLYGFMVVLLIITFYGAWIYMWLSGKETLTNLLALLKEVTGGAFVTFIAFIGGCFVDTDGDGIPDSFDKHDDRKDSERGGLK